jgi:hypothetical protein
MASKDRTVAPKKVLEMMKEITGQSDDDVCAMLQLCNGDATLATEKLLECRYRAALWSRAAAALPHAHVQALLKRSSTRRRRESR